MIILYDGKIAQILSTFYYIFFLILQNTILCSVSSLFFNFSLLKLVLNN